MLQLIDAGFEYVDGKFRRRVFRGISLTIKDGEFFCILGPSGCGKSTLLKVVAGFERPTEGVILDNGEKVEGVSHERAMVFQEDAVFPWLTVYGNVEFGLQARGIPLETRKRIAMECVKLVGLEAFANAYPRQLSGGMRKRVDLARVLAGNPRIFLMDEPFGALDALTKEKLQVEFLRIWEGSGKTVLFVTHDIEEALFLGDRVGIMYSAETGKSMKVFDIPFKRPRELSLKEEPDFQRMRRHLFKELQFEG